MMRCINKDKREDFAHEFMRAYRSPGLGKPYIRMAYGEAFEVIELRNSYVVRIRGTQQRFNNVLSMAEYIYDRNYNPRYVYTMSIFDEDIKRNERKKKNSSLRRLLSFLNPFKSQRFHVKQLAGR